MCSPKYYVINVINGINPPFAVEWPLLRSLPWTGGLGSITAYTADVAPICLLNEGHSQFGSALITLILLIAWYLWCESRSDISKVMEPGGWHLPLARSRPV